MKWMNMGFSISDSFSGNYWLLSKSASAIWDWEKTLPYLYFDLLWIQMRHTTGLVWESASILSLEIRVSLISGLVSQRSSQKQKKKNTKQRGRLLIVTSHHFHLTCPVVTHSIALLCCTSLIIKNRQSCSSSWTVFEILNADCARSRLFCQRRRVFSGDRNCQKITKPKDKNCVHKVAEMDSREWNWKFPHFGCSP